MAVPSVRLRTAARGRRLVIYDEIITVVQVLQEADIVGIVVKCCHEQHLLVENPILNWK